MNKNNIFKELFIKYIVIYFAIYLSYFLSALYSEINNIIRDFGLKDELILYGVFSIFQTLIILFIIILFFDVIYKTKIKNLNLFFIIFFITIFYLISISIINFDNPIIYLIYYIIGIGIYGYYLEKLKK